MTDNTDQSRTEIEPLVPIMPRERPQPDGGSVTITGVTEPERPAATDHATEFERADEEIEPMVPIVSGKRPQSDSAGERPKSDSGSATITGVTEPERSAQTDHETEFERDAEEIESLAPETSK